MNSTIGYLQELPHDVDIAIPTLVECVLRDAVAAGASDIHIEPWQNTIAVRIRLDGVLTELVHLPLELLDRISTRCKVLANLVTYKADVPQEGHVEAGPELGNAELRVSIFPGVRGEKIVIRIFDPNARSFNLESLGFEEETLAAFTKLLSRPGGLILLTGPTGSGKTTTIYSALAHICQRAGPAVSISTIEDPVEVWLPMITQSQINLAKDFSYPVALRALLRQDPQVIMVGEIRDSETAAIALQAGLTGHLVISTIHSGSSAGVFARLINMDIEPFLLSSSMIGVLGVRLLRKSCLVCQQPYEPDPRVMRLLPADAAQAGPFRRGVGCPECHQTGYAGRTLVTELLAVDETMREAILQKMPTRQLHQVAIGQGLQTLWHMGLRRVTRGETTLEELTRVVAPD